VVWALVISHILRVASFLRLKYLAHSPVCAELGLQASFGDDTLAYCTERMDPEVTRLALAAALHQAKRNKAFENSRFIGLALDGTGAGRTYKQPICFGRLRQVRRRQVVWWAGRGRHFPSCKPAAWEESAGRCERRLRPPVGSA
jgi:hypothetical protein